MGKRILHYLGRITSSGKHIAEIDALRFIAITLVVLFHISIYVTVKCAGKFDSAPEGTGLFTLLLTFRNGVQLFFAISGFILAAPFALAYRRGVPPPSIAAYLKRRLTRLEPPYVIAMIASAVLLVILKHQDLTDILRHLSASLVYAHGLNYATQNPIEFVAWSLEVEVQFYLLMPLMALVYRIPNRYTRGIIIGGTALAFIVLQRYFFPGLPDDVRTRVSLSLANQLQYFLAGMFLADLYVEGDESFGSRSRGWDLVSIVGWPALLVIWNFPTIVTAVLFPVAVVLLYVAVFRGTFTNAVMRNPWLSAVGGMCYTIYLLHMPLVSFIGPFYSDLVLARSWQLTVALQFAIIGIPLLLACSVFFVAIEKPCMRKTWPRELRDFLAGRLRAERTVAAIGAEEAV